jgi:hypothetical protein
MRKYALDLLSHSSFGIKIIKWIKRFFLKSLKVSGYALKKTLDLNLMVTRCIDGTTTNG